MKRKQLIWISAPMSVSLRDIGELARSILIYEGHQIAYWKQTGNYNQTAFNSADSMVIILPGKAWDSNHLPVGCRRELAEAIKQGKPIFLGYQKKDGTWGVYDARITNIGGGQYFVKGVPCTDPLAKIRRTTLGNDVCSEIELNASTDWKETSNALIDLQKQWKEAELPVAQKVYAQTIPNPDYQERRLLLML